MDFTIAESFFICRSGFGSKEAPQLDFFGFEAELSTLFSSKQRNCCKMWDLPKEKSNNLPGWVLSDYVTSGGSDQENCQSLNAITTLKSPKA